MKVLYVSKASLVAAHRDKVRALAERTEVELVMPERWGRVEPEPAPFDDRFPVHLRPAWLHGHNHLHLYRGVEPILERGGFDLVHVDEEPYSAVTLQMTGLARRHGVSPVFFAWQNLSKRLPPPFGWLRRRVFGRSAGGIAGTGQAARVLRRAGYGGPVEVIPQMGVDTERFRPRDRKRVRRGPGPESDPVVAGFVGRLVPEKGVDVLVRAMASTADTRLVIVGEGPEGGPLRALAGELGVDDRTTFTGPVPSLRMPAVMNTLDVLVLPSLTTRGWAEQFGRVLVEAMACRVPVVGSDSGAIPEVVGDAGLVVPEGDVEALAGALGRLRDEPDLRETLARRGRERVLERFAQERVAEATVGFWREVLEGRAAGLREGIP